MACERTVLLETSPGHATRCAPAPFVDAFERRAGRAGGRRAPTPGRCGPSSRPQPRPPAHRVEGPRAATATQLVAVDDDEQRARGHVHDRPGRGAARRRSPPSPPCTREVSDGRHRAASTAAVDAAPGQRRARRPDAARPLDVAIVGMACVIPGRRRRRAVLGQHRRRRRLGHRGAGRALGRRALLRPRARSPRTPASRPRRSGAGSCPTSPFDAAAPTASRPRSLASIEPVQLLSLEVAAARPGRRRLRRPAVRPRRGRR